MKPRDPAGQRWRSTSHGALADWRPTSPRPSVATRRECIACDRPPAGCGASSVRSRIWSKSGGESRSRCELKWLAGLLGEVRDLDILLARLRESAAELERTTRRPAIACTAFQRAGSTPRPGCGEAVADSLESDRYHALLETLEQGALAVLRLRMPRVEPAASCCRTAAKAAWRRLRKAARDLRRERSRRKNFTKLRKRAKRCRYTAELIAPLLGRHAARAASEFIRLTTRVQDSLGEHQDALITAGELERALEPSTPMIPHFVERASALLEDQRKRARCRPRPTFSRSGPSSTARSFADG